MALESSEEFARLGIPDANRLIAGGGGYPCSSRGPIDALYSGSVPLEGLKQFARLCIPEANRLVEAPGDNPRTRRILVDVVNKKAMP